MVAMKVTCLIVFFAVILLQVDSQSKSLLIIPDDISRVITVLQAPAESTM